MNLENVILSERHYSQKTIRCTNHLYKMSRTGKPKDTEVDLWLQQLEEGIVVTANGYGVSFLG